ncbi:DUF5996 family protein [Erythrobacter ani]|uniref:Ava_C0101 and related proteins n=1 Tax=Erythrobacter ani TaxID=2827235 RepID=A0ABS6SK98_9SPHN|nr:DUF5996 family protein [Erythrobacter ani]MBV7265453.1 hypothetical protein [Erythrobacter ani]
MSRPWPDIPYEPWAETCAALHLMSQVVGKVRIAHTPWVNHSWHATLYVTPRGLTTGPIHHENGCLTLSFDLQDHLLVCENASGWRASTELGPTSISDFTAGVGRLVEGAGAVFDIHGAPNEIPDPVPFAEDHVQRPYDADAVERFHDALLQIDRVFSRFSTAFLGKTSPVHLFWGSFDLAVTRFSGQPAPEHPGGVPYLPDAVTREAYSHEVSSAGFWPGNGGAGEAMFYSYAYPVPEGFSAQTVEPDSARWDSELGEFVLPYEAVRTSEDPEATLLAFLQSTYTAASRCADWDAALNTSLQKPGIPRTV